MTTAQAADIARKTGIEFNSRAYRSATHGKVMLFDVWYPADRQPLFDALQAAGCDVELTPMAHIYGNRPGVRVCVRNLE